jgi:hypothetical protein
MQFGQRVGVDCFGNNYLGVGAMTMGFEGTIGALLVKHLKEAIEAEKFRGGEISLWLSDGWFSKYFIVKGSDESVTQILNFMNALKERIDR